MVSADLAQQLADAQGELGRALRLGEDTAAIRVAIAKIQAGIAAADAAQQLQALEAAHAVQRASGERATSRLAEVLAHLPSPSREHCAMQTAVPPEYEAAIARLESTQRALEQATNRQSNVQREFDRLNQRMAVLVRERQAIGHRRLRGDAQADDAGTVALIDLDAAGIGELRAQADSVLGSAAADARIATERVADATRVLFHMERRMVAENALACLAEMDNAASKMLALFGKTITEMDAAGGMAVLPHAVAFARAADQRLLTILADLETIERRAGRIGSPAWGASQPLLLRLRQIAVRRNEL